VDLAKLASSGASPKDEYDNVFNLTDRGTVSRAHQRLLGHAPSPPDLPLSNILWE